MTDDTTDDESVRPSGAGCLDCDQKATRVVTKYGGVAPLCDEHAEERLEADPKTVDQTAYFRGERDEPKPEPSPNRPPTTETITHESDCAHPDR